MSNKTMQDFVSTGTIRFDVPSQSVAKPQYSYLMIRPRIFAATSTGNPPLRIPISYLGATAADPNIPVPASNLYAALSSCPVSCLFQKISFSSMNAKVSELNHPAEASQILSMCNESTSQLNSSFSTNHVWWLKGDDMLARGLGLAPLATNITTTNRIRAENIFRQYYLNSFKTPFCESAEAQLNWVPPLGVFNMPEEFYLPPNSTHEFSFTVEPNWRQNIITGLTKPNPPLVATGLTVLPTNTTLTDANHNNIFADIFDIALMVCFSDTYERITKSITYESPDIECQKLSLQANTTYGEISFSIPKGTYKLYLAFADARATGNDTRFSPTNFALFHNNDGNNNIVSILNTFSFTFNGNVYPRVPYDFQNGISYARGDMPIAGLNIAGTNTYDVNRAYQDFIFASDALLDSSGTIMSYFEWSLQPVFCFKIINPAGSTSSIAKLNLRTTGPVIPDNTSIVVLTLAKREVTYNYDPNGILNSIDYADLI
ncbi:MAG: hypothetical protein ACRCX2_22910 [Paraclostridium sp.]